MVASMPPGSVVVDVSIDQGGCIETSRLTSHSQPTYVAHGVTHYCVPNMPGTYPRTATLALTAATLPYVLRIASGSVAAVAADAGFAKGVNVIDGRIAHRGVAEALGELERYAPWPSRP
jgi:alanine dehydrogenase